MELEIGGYGIASAVPPKLDVGLPGLKKNYSDLWQENFSRHYAGGSYGS